eukprot:COSAG06_NODE_9167_length_1969_cov_1.381283_3_plen_71_part_00
MEVIACRAECRAQGGGVVLLRVSRTQETQFNKVTAAVYSHCDVQTSVIQSMVCTTHALSFSIPQHEASCQ